jgi:hypothetical protein
MFIKIPWLSEEWILDPASYTMCSAPFAHAPTPATPWVAVLPWAQTLLNRYPQLHFDKASDSLELC